MNPPPRNPAVIYLDHAATTRCHPDVVEAMRFYLEEEYGNPASMHMMGKHARHAVQQATRQVAQLIGARENELTFTSGATESNNIALFSSIGHDERAPVNAILCPIDHKSVLSVGEELERRGVQIRRLAVQSNGTVSLDSLHRHLDEHTRILSVSYVNSELGIIQPVEEIARITRDRGVLLHIDAVQAVGKLPVDVNELGCDLLSISAHKLGGPKGIGALYVSSRIARRLRPFIFGGGQSVLRSGTMPTPLVVGFGLACQRAGESLATNLATTACLRDYFLGELRRGVPDLRVNTDLTASTPYILNVQLPGVSTEALVTGLRRVAISSGSACNSESVEPSYVLRGIGLTKDEAGSSIRLCFMPHLTREELSIAIEELVSKINAIRDVRAAA